MKEILRSLRNENNYSQSAVASYLEISRQMYNKYENGSAEPSVKNIKKLCELYKVSADVFFQEKPEKDLYSNKSESSSNFYVASPTVTYGSSSILSKNNSSLFDELVNFLPKLKLTEQVTLMTKLAILIEKQTFAQGTSIGEPVIKPKKLKKIPDAEYNNYLNSDESRQVSKSSLANIREILKDDEW